MATEGLRVPETRYARLGDEQIAYQVWGDGPIDLVALRPMWVPVDFLWDEPRVVRILERLGGFARNVWFDPRGVGSRSSVTSWVGPELWVEDLETVMAAVHSERAAIFGIEDGGTGALQYAATHPERVSALVLLNGFARFARAPDYPIGMPQEALQRYIEAIRATWGTTAMIETLAPSKVHDPLWTRWWLRSQRLAQTPDAVADAWRNNTASDVHRALSSIEVPTLVLHRRGNRHVRIEHARYLAEHLPNATYRELDGDDHLFLAGDADAVVDEVQEFLTGVRPAPVTSRALTTVLFTDIVGSSERAAVLGDERWRALLDAHDEIVRSHLVRFGGREVNTTGDGFVATFDMPAQGIRCAVEVAAALRSIGVNVRVGLHTGEVELRDEDIGGIAVHIAARVQANAEPGEVWVSRTVKDLVVGSAIAFVDRGDHELKGVPETWRLYSVEP